MTKQGKEFITVARRRWRNSETPGSGEQYSRGAFTLRNCQEGKIPSWRLFGNGIDFYGHSPQRCIERLNALANVIRDVVGSRS